MSYSDPEKEREYNRTYHLKHRAQRLPESRERWRQWRLTNREKHLAYSRGWYEKNKARAKASMRNYRDKNHATLSKYHKIYGAIWQRNNPHKMAHKRHKRRAMIKNLPTEDCSQKIQLLLRTIKFCHWCCCRLTPKIIRIDHVVPLHKSGHHVNDNLVACCVRCNCSKRDKLVHEWLPTIQSA